MNVEFIDNSDEVIEAMRNAAIRALEKCGLTGERYAKENLTKNKSVDTGLLRNSVAHTVDEDELAAYIGVPQGPTSYGIYVEFGTGEYYPCGRPTPWVYQDAKGNWHRTHGQKAQPFLKPAVADHAQTYRNIIEDEMKNQ